MIEEFGKLIVQILQFFVKLKLKDDEPIRALYNLYFGLTKVLKDSACFLDAVEDFAIQTDNQILQEKVYDRLIVLGETIEGLAREMANGCLIVPARIFIGDAFADEILHMLGLKCERLFFWADLFRNPHFRIQKKLVWLVKKAENHLPSELPRSRMWMTPAQCAKGEIQDLKSLAERSADFTLEEVSLADASESQVLFLASEGRRWVAAMRNARTALGEYLRKNYPMDEIRMFK